MVQYQGVPYTLGLLLSGQAGAGKTSSIKCLANETNRHIININLNNDITKNQLENLFFNEMIMVLNVVTGQNEKYEIPLNKRIYVLEDIDCQGDLVHERSKTSKDDKSTSVSNSTDKIDLSFLLNLLDGVLEIPGRIVIMTSNHISKLDHALIRPGRIDIIADFKKCISDTLVKMIEFFYDIKLSTCEKSLIMGIRDFIVSPAEMGKIMFENFDDYTITIKTLTNMSTNFVDEISIIVESEEEYVDEHNNPEKVENDDNSITISETNLNRNIDVNHSLSWKNNNEEYPEIIEIEPYASDNFFASYV